MIISLTCALKHSEFIVWIAAVDWHVRAGAWKCWLPRRLITERQRRALPVWALVGKSGIELFDQRSLGHRRLCLSFWPEHREKWSTLADWRKRDGQSRNQKGLWRQVNWQELVGRTSGAFPTKHGVEIVLIGGNGGGDLLSFLAPEYLV